MRVRERDSVVGIAMAFGLGLGVLFLSLYPRFATQAFAILFGSITGVSRGDVALLIGDRGGHPRRPRRHLPAR